MSNTGPKKVPTLRDPKDPEQVAVFMREVRELIRTLGAADEDLQAQIDDLPEPSTGGSYSPPIPQSDVTDLVSDLAGKANAVHTHPESDITGLVSDLAGKQPLDAGLTSLAGLGATAGLVEKTATDTYTERLLGVGASTSVPTRADADARYAAISAIAGTVNTISKFTSAGAVGDSSITDSGGDVFVGLDTGTSSKVVNFGRDTSLSTTNQNGYRIWNFADGNNYIDSKVASGGYTFLRTGAGAESGGARSWANVQGSSGNVGFYFNVNIDGNTTLGNSTSDAHALNGTLNANSTAGSDGQVLAIGGGVPAWQRVPFSGASVYNSGNQSIPDATYTALTFDSERHDVGGYHSTSSNTSRLTVPETGYYHIKISVGLASGTGHRYVKIRKNGTTDIAGDVTFGTGGTNFLHDSTSALLTSGDYVEALVYQASGGSMNAVGTTNQTFDIQLIGA